MTTTCPRQNNVKQFLEVSKICQVTWLESSTFKKKSLFNFALNVFFMKELKGAILSQNHRRSQGSGPGGPEPLNWNATNDKNLPKNTLFLHFQFLLASWRTTVINKLYWRPRGPAYPLNSIFSNQSKRITRVKSRIFVRKLLSQALILTFYERNAITSAVFAT